MTEPQKELAAAPQHDDTTNDNPFQSYSAEQPTPLSIPLRRHYRSIFVRILTTFFLLSATPITLSAILTAATYQSSIRAYLPESSVVHIEQVLLAQNILILLLVVIMVVFAGSLITSSLIRPLKRLLELTHIVASGQLNYRLKSATRDEIGELTEAFNIMVGRLREQQARERTISQMKSEFISIAAHQLRTPLSAVKWTIKMMLDGDIGIITKEQHEFLERGYQVNERMITLVGDLLNVARIEEGRFGYVFASINFIEYVDQFISRYKEESAQRQITITFTKPNATIPPLNIDAAKMDLVFQNLIDNAFKYSHNNSVITINMQLLPKYLEIKIADQGVGVPAHQIHRLFTKFFRGDNVIRMQTEGSGLGLFIVKNIIKNHGGDIHVESQENKGTTFIFTLPLSRTMIPSREITFEEFVGGLG